ncbi:MAG: hypothetical protein R3E79_25915 [Caldilineaceae bacterium]
MIDYRNDPHIQRLFTHSDQLLRRSEEACRQSHRSSEAVKRLLERDLQLNCYVNELLRQTVSPYSVSEQ